MWNYEKRLQYPISISTPNAKMASFIISQYGGPDGEMGASMRYLAQRFSFANPRIAGVLTDIGTEELAHLEMIGAIVRQLTRGLSAKELEASGFAPYYIDHTAGVWPQAAGGVPFSATEFQSSGDAIADLVEDMAAEQKARKTYDNILRLAKDQEVADPIRFCVSVKLCIFSVLARLFVCCRKNWTAKTTMLSIPILTVCKTLHDRTGDSRPFHTGRLSQKKTQ